MRRLSPSSLMILRFLLISDGLIVAVVGLLCVLYVDRPAGLVAAAGAWLLAGLLFGAVRYTDPYRGQPW